MSTINSGLLGRDIPFPALHPSSRVYQLGTPPTKEFVSMNGSVQLVNYGRQLLSDKLKFGFKALKYEKAREIYLNYIEVMREGAWVQFRAGHPCFDDARGYQGMLTGNHSGGRWRYESPPTFTALTNGRVDVEVSLIKKFLVD